jgi:hypothetical protein
MNNSENRGEPRFNTDEELTQSPEEPSAAIRAQLMRERFDTLWHGSTGRIFRYAVVFTVAFLLIILILMGIETYSK